MDALKEEFEVFKSSISRMQWFMTTAVLISVLILLHIYLEQFGFQDHQLASIFAHRVQQSSGATLKCYEKLAFHLQRKASGLSDADFPKDSCNEQLIPKETFDKIMELSKEKGRFLREYSRLEFTTRVTDNTLKDTKLQIRRIPLLGIEVPANDFVTVMAIMSLVFVVGVWINLRGVKAALTALASRGLPDVMKLAKLNTVFLTSLETQRGNLLARMARSMGIWLPFLSILTATILGYWEFLAQLAADGARGHWGPMGLVFGHMAVAAIVILLHLWIANECKYVLKDIDTLLQGT